jgi:hypothetical protein
LITGDRTNKFFPSYSAGKLAAQLELHIQPPASATKIHSSIIPSHSGSNDTQIAQINNLD